MTFDFVFLTNSILLGVGLAMDAFSVSLANGLQESEMPKRRACFMAGIFAFFQALMPMIGWLCVHLFISVFTSFQKYIPWIALILLLYLGGSMIFDAFKCKCCEDETCGKLTFGLLMVQGIATSIDAMSGGVTMAAEKYMFSDVAISVAIIAAMTFAICVAGIYLGKVFGTKLANKASIFGGSILIIIGIIILVKSFMGA